MEESDQTQVKQPLSPTTGCYDDDDDDVSVMEVHFNPFLLSSLELLFNSNHCGTTHYKQSIPTKHYTVEKYPVRLRDWMWYCEA